LLPDVDGLQLLHDLQSGIATQRIPVVIATAKANEADIVAGLEAGADDYVTKPFSVPILSARVRAVLRRKKERPLDSVTAIRCGDIVMHPYQHEVFVGNKPVCLTPTEFRILHLLLQHQQQAFSRHQLAKITRRGTRVPSDRSIDVQVVSLRKKLGRSRRYIESVPGIGYRLNGR
jgi:two-component system, OmpR family, alkaline phosphatase synthesis response regulator PhoP